MIGEDSDPADILAGEFAFWGRGAAPARPQDGGTGHQQPFRASRGPEQREVPQVASPRHPQPHSVAVEPAAVAVRVAANVRQPRSQLARVKLDQRVARLAALHKRLAHFPHTELLLCGQTVNKLEPLGEGEVYAGPGQPPPQDGRVGRGKPGRPDHLRLPEPLVGLAECDLGGGRLPAPRPVLAVRSKLRS